MVDIGGLDGHCPVTAEHDKLKQLKELFKSGLVSHSTSKYIAFDLLGWCLSFPDQLLQSFFDLLVVVHDILKNDVDKTHLCLEQLYCSSTREILPVFIMRATRGLQGLDNTYRHADAGVQGGTAPQVIQARHQIIHSHASCKRLCKHFTKCIQC